jgi:hypothetical protein
VRYLACANGIWGTSLERADLQAVGPALQDPDAHLNVGLELIEIYTATEELEKAAALVEILSSKCRIK